MKTEKPIIEIWGIPTCATTRKAVKFLQDNDVPYVYKNLRDTPMPAKILRDVLANVDNPRRAFNTSGTSYKDGNWKDRIAEMTTQALIIALHEDPMLVKRPVLRSEKGLVLGYDEAAIRSIL